MKTTVNAVIIKVNDLKEMLQRADKKYIWYSDIPNKNKEQIEYCEELKEKFNRLEAKYLKLINTIIEVSK